MMNRRTRIVKAKVRQAMTTLGPLATYREIADEAGVSVASAHKFGKEVEAAQAGADLGMPPATPAQQVGGSMEPNHRPVDDALKEMTANKANTPKDTEHGASAKFRGKCDQCGESIAKGDPILVDDDPSARLPKAKGQGTRKPIRHETCPGDADTTGHDDDRTRPDTPETGHDRTPDTTGHDGQADDLKSALDGLDSTNQGSGSGSGQNSPQNDAQDQGDPSQGDGGGGDGGSDDDDPYARESWVMERIEPVKTVIKQIGEIVMQNLGAIQTLQGDVSTLRDDVVDVAEGVAKNEANLDRHNLRLESVETDLTTVTGMVAENEHRIERLEKSGVGGPRTLTVEVPDWDVVTTFPEGEHFHENFDLAVNTLKATNHLWLGGPTGGGKTHMAEQIARALGLPFFMYSCTQGMLESKFEGKRWLDGTFQSTAWIEWGENGGVMLLDEADGMNDNVRLMLNSFLANGRMALPNRIDNPMMIRHEKALIIIGTNTWGQGANGDYSGRDSIDLATRDRFAAMKVWLGYDRDLERKIPEIAILGDFEDEGNGKPWRPASVSDSLAVCFERIRRNIETYSIPSQAMSTRTKMNAGRLKAQGVSPEDILMMYFTGWDEIDKNKAIEGLTIAEVL
jgi:hypothetical protein